jgi:protein-disulfide isomerase
MDNLFNGDQNLFKNDMLSKAGEDDALQFLANYVSNTLKIDAATFIKTYQNDDISTDARIEFKNSASHSVAGTPTFFVNTVPTDVEPDCTLDQWRQLIDSLLQTLLTFLNHFL